MKHLSDIFSYTLENGYGNNNYVNRELSWLDFNYRVLNQTKRPDIPLLEKFRFLGITESNLEEFIMVRLASVINKMDKEFSRDISGLSPIEEFRSISKGIQGFKSAQHQVYTDLTKELRKTTNISIVKVEELSQKEMNIAKKLFLTKISPILCPINYDTTKDFPFIKSKQHAVIVQLFDTRSANDNIISVVPLHLEKFNQFVLINEEKKRYILIMDLILHFIDLIFSKKKIMCKGIIKVIRDGDVCIDDEEGVFIVDKMKKTLLDRKFSNIIYMEVYGKISKETQKVLSKIFGIPKSSISNSKNIVDYTGLCKTLFGGKYPELEFAKFKPAYPNILIAEKDMFTVIDKGDFILHHPFDSYEPVIKFLEHAAKDEDVISIRQTLYRVSSTDSPIVNALCEAAKRGKEVIVLLELKARFDEEQNISLINKFKNSGCQIIYGEQTLKNHCKMISVVRQTNKGLNIYTHIGTGNYNDKTANIYTDISYFTKDKKLGIDVINVFNHISGFSVPKTTGDKLFFSPKNLRKKLVEMIDKQIKLSREGEPAQIFIKVNSFSDKKMIDKIYEASEAGVKIIIICRGICSIKPINRNIFIKSIVGRFLEHSRIYAFGTDMKQIFISSADLLTRNLDKRVEFLVRIKDTNCKNYITKLLDLYLKDNVNSVIINGNTYCNEIEPGRSFDVHSYLAFESHSQRYKNIPKMK